MLGQDHYQTMIGRDVYGNDGEKIGTVGQVYADTTTGQPEWLSVNTGLFGMNESFVPLQGARYEGDRVEVAYDKTTVKDAPNVATASDEPLGHEEEQRLFGHYGLTYGGAGYSADETFAGDVGYRDAVDADAGATASAAGATTGYDRSRTDDAMTRSEERLSVGTERQQVGRARLRKYVVTEHVQQTVPVRREEVRLEREPITEGNRDAAYAGSEITESEHEVTLHAERPVVSKETVPVERVRLDKAVVTEEETVAEDVRREHIEADLPGEGKRKLG
jgi:uncharacterized protein (TIGR02271 family)